MATANLPNSYVTIDQYFCVYDVMKQITLTLMKKMDDPPHQCIIKI